ncbi:MAG TPA: dipeptide epimerase [Sediminispirochaeta sp.]|nr:dipeptide epimerase [Sediminispirochaeta sp.]
MRIERCEAWPVELDLAEPFSIAYSTIDSTVNYFLRLETDRGLLGYGCAAPDEEVTGENAASIRQALNEVAIPILRSADLRYTSRLLSEIHFHLADQPTAAAAADIAIFDLLARSAGIPLYQYLGAYRDSIVTSITIGIMPLEDTLRKARKWKSRGFRAIKLKGGLDLEGDIEKVQRLRELLGPETALRFDANQGYSRSEALRLIGEVGQELEFLEQPCGREDVRAFGELRVGRRVDASDCPLMADEAVLGPEDTFALIAATEEGGLERVGAKRKGPELCNIKLAKSGGIRRAAAMDSVAAAAGVGTMVGCMDEAGLGVAAGLAFALSSPNVRYADLDGHLEFLNDPSAAALRLEDGLLYPLEAEGLGINP